MTAPAREAAAEQAALRPPPGPVPGFIGRIAAKAYGAEVARRNRRYDRGVGVRKASVPVISVGNLSVGGTGKTPMVAHLCGVLLQNGKHPAIAMRGYSPRKGASGEAADEPDLYRRTLPGVPVLVSPDRAGAIGEHLSASPRPRTDCVVLDDGFQHRRLHRDCDLVLIDATRSPFDDALLPAGWLREPVESLGRASGVIITHAGLISPDRLRELGSQVAWVHGRRPIAATRHVWTALRRGEETLPLDALLGKRVMGVCAIGNPGPFLADLRLHVGGELAGEISLRDHDPFNDATVHRIAAAAGELDADAIVVTDKDWSKLRTRAGTTLPCPVLRPVLSLSFLWGADALEQAALAALAP